MQKHNKKSSQKDIKELESQIKKDQMKPVRDNERRVRFSDNFETAVKKMANTIPINNKDLVKWARKQKKDTE